jgi:hypothetical protein
MGADRVTGSDAISETLANEIKADGGTVNRVDSQEDELGIIATEFPAGVRPILAATSRVAMKDYAVELSHVGPTSKENHSELQHFLRPTKLLPTEGIVKSAATEITRGADNDVEKARALYDWIVDHTFRDPRTRGCGVGDIRFMLESGDLGGKCADLNALFVGLARAAGLPARDVHGIRIAKSEMGFKSLEGSSANVTKAQHCRAEVYIGGIGWLTTLHMMSRCRGPAGDRSDFSCIRRRRRRKAGSIRSLPRHLSMRSRRERLRQMVSERILFCCTNAEDLAKMYTKSASR